jgi:hypothetical protein
MELGDLREHLGLQSLFKKPSSRSMTDVTPFAGGTSAKLALLLI